MRHIIITLFCFSLAAPAAAHHGAISPDVEGTLQSQIGLEFTSADYDLGSRGSWNMLRLLGEYAPLSWLSLNAALPFARTAPAEGTSAVGIGDVEVGFKFLALDLEPLKLRLRVGLDAELPTGNKDNGIGSGHAELIPNVSVTARVHSKLVLKSSMRFSVGIEGAGDGHSHAGHDHGDAGHGSAHVVGAHGGQELVGDIRLALTDSWGFVSVGAEVIYGIADPVGLGPVIAHVEVGVPLTKQLWLVGAVALPTTAENQYLWRTRAGITWVFDSPNANALASCSCDKPEPTQKTERADSHAQHSGGDA